MLVPFLVARGVKTGLNTKKFDRCVTKVKRKSGKKVNPYAVLMQVCLAKQDLKGNSIREH
jgi:hypothetical protein